MTKPGTPGAGGWIRSKWSTPYNNCVEARLDRSGAGVRDSKDAASGALAFGRRQWREFLARVVR